MIDFELDNLRNSYRSDNNLINLPVVLGDADGNVVDPTIPGRVLVRQVVSQNLFVPFSVGAPNTKMALDPGLPIELELDRFGELRIKGYDNSAVLAGGGSPLANVVDTSKVAQQDFATLLPQPTQPSASTTINVKGWQPKIDNVRYDFPGGSIDLASVIPSAGNQAWIVIALQSDISTLVAESSTPVSMFDILDKDAAIQEAIDAIATLDPKSTYIWALLLSNGQTEITQEDFEAGEDQRDAINSYAASISGDGYVVLAPDSSTRNVIQPTGDFKALVVKNNAAQSVNIFEHQDSSSNPLAFIASSGELTAVKLNALSNDVTTGAVVNVATFTHNTTGTGGPGIGTGATFASETSTTPDTVIATINASFPVATHASRTARVTFNLTDSAATRTVLQLDANGSVGSATVNGNLQATSINTTPIGTTTPSTGAFTSITVTPAGSGVVPITGNIPSGSSSNILELQRNASSAFVVNQYGYLSITPVNTATGTVVSIVLPSAVWDASPSLIDFVRNSTTLMRFGLESGIGTLTSLTGQLRIQGSGNPGIRFLVQSTTTILELANGSGQAWNARFTGAAAARAAVVFKAAASPSTAIVEVQNSSDVPLITVNTDFSMTIKATDTATVTVTNALTIGHNGGSVVAGFGTGLLVQGESSTTNDTNMGRIYYDWQTATHASRKARSYWTVYDTSERIGIEIEASGTAPMVGFYGVAPVVQAAAYTQTYSTVTRTVNPASTAAFTGIDNAQGGTPYAQLTDLNQLRTDMLQLAQLINSLIDDSQGIGIAQ